MDLRHHARCADAAHVRRGRHDVPSWSPAGDPVFFTREAPPRPGPSIAAQPADGAGQSQVVLETRRATNTAVSPDGRFIAYSESGTDVAKMGPELWYASVDGRVPPRQFTSDPAAQQDPRFSPDGRDLAYVSFESGRQEVYVKTFPGAEGKWQISVNGGRRRGGAVAARCCSCSPARR